MMPSLCRWMTQHPDLDGAAGHHDDQRSGARQRGLASAGGEVHPRQWLRPGAGASGWTHPMTFASSTAWIELPIGHPAGPIVAQSGSGVLWVAGTLGDIERLYKSCGTSADHHDPALCPGASPRAGRDRAVQDSLRLSTTRRGDHAGADQLSIWLMCRPQKATAAAAAPAAAHPAARACRGGACRLGLDHAGRRRYAGRRRANGGTEPPGGAGPAGEGGDIGGQPRAWGQHGRAAAGRPTPPPHDPAAVAGHAANLLTLQKVASVDRNTFAKAAVARDLRLVVVTVFSFWFLLRRFGEERRHGAGGRGWRWRRWEEARPEAAGRPPEWVELPEMAGSRDGRGLE